MKWTENAWKEIEGIYTSVTEMPFNQELMSGTLSLDRFRFYMQQDGVYLAEFSRALALIAARCFNHPYTLDFIRFAERAVVVERSLHEGYFRQFNVTGDAEASPTCHNYTQFLLTKASLDQVEVAMAAVLPCFWIYKKVGDHIYQYQDGKNNPYQDWIDTYAGEEFGLLVEKAIEICDDVASRCSDLQREQMTKAFVMASRLEWMFWDSAYQLEKWPI
ncbi:thiaminase II [Pedobacter hartonius]|uniref:Aminopyrimidine aminohydrolase n=1 Tax=Pedobacter hartonius TaxID=425514 RepID=A0A1H4BIW6_9SPHI|nr:thiaminase II [Pedobacter hartonius]SEA47742.1 thiaminase /4-amino-5-aminomethyl-2-methylpyrimidine deaminase [Pedobacter hartonius]